MTSSIRHIEMGRLSKIQENVSHIRNICVLAHVDHGKTTLADSLVASNGIISNKLAGKLRYLDSRPDEQLRGITMKSSSITLHHVHDKEEYVVNLIDSPGHVDFSSEVSTAVRLSDGALIIVDVVEGVCPQTRSVLSVSYIEGLKPILILNKIDRLITEMKLSPLDAYVRLTQILEQVNAVMGEIFASDVMEREDREEIAATTNRTNERSLADWQSALEEIDDSNLYFSPEQGNVLFASAYDGWGFGLKEFAKIYADKLGFSEKVLRKTLWGDFYVNNKTKRIMKGAQEKAKKPLFVQLILDNIWVLYETLVIRKDKGKLSHMAEKLNVKLTTRDLRHTDPKVQLQAICSQWLPLARACIDMVCEVVPAPDRLSGEKVERLLSGNNNFRALHLKTQQLKSAFLECNPSTYPTVAFVSKMFPVDRDMLPENKSKPLTPEELAHRKEIARQRHAERMLRQVNGGEETAMNNNEDLDDKPDNALVAFARVYSGTIQVGQDLFVLGPKHNPAIALERMNKGELMYKDEYTVESDLKSEVHITRVTIRKLYLLMGRDLVAVDRVPAGNVCGIGGLEKYVLKTATLSTTIACPSFTELTSLAVPILRVAVEPKHPQDLPRLIDGLKLLNQADACAVVRMQENGEIVLNTAGEVHLERCLEDLNLRYAKIDINVSEPIVPLRETIVPPPKLDMVNEAIEKKTEEVSLEMWTPHRQCRFEMDARPLPESITKILERNAGLMKLLDNYCDDHAKASVSDKKRKEIAAFRNELEAAFDEAGWKEEFDRIWSFGPRKCGPNVLLNATDYKQKRLWDHQDVNHDPRAMYDNSVINGFQLATLAGPLCEEPMMGVCFIVKKWEMFYVPQSHHHQSRGLLNGHVMSTFKEACRRIFSLRRPRLVMPMYSCNVLVNSDVLGKLYAVFGKRQGRVISADSAHGFGGHFRVLAVLPVQESFHLARELRTQTSGLASPQLVFSHWELLEQDPYWVPSTEEEYLHFGEKADCANRAKKYMDAVRRRKGLPVDSQLVTHAEKQRTLSKNK
ncbi:PREDICTED: elongation factor Tu GTP-binding domain-containing protein 1 [Dinoponera quadriceps]|uniref:Ribosome assembly protein 1 n=1 Tax=Dinoponera quadriceps TaxID=609295 RepID=A0A6P3X3G3_DINQU|nr:PREDICTED: elongation factor Tu GTP-binding domain-containing protein 1 [Dinoponera quadriceps]